MRRTVFLLLTLALLTVPVCAVQLPGELLDALPNRATGKVQWRALREKEFATLFQA